MIAGFSFYDILSYFLVYSFLGWCLEVVYCTIVTGKAVNRGFLNGPVCPIYGFGMVAILLLLTPLIGNLPLLYLFGTLLPSSIELFGGWALYKLYRTRWWDYSDRPFNIGGFICLQFCLLWGLGAVMMMRIFHPMIAAGLRLIPQTAGIILMLVMYAVYAADFVITAVSVAGFTRELEALDQIGTGLKVVSESMSEVLGTKALATDQRMDERRLQLKLAAAEIRTAAAELTPQEAADKARGMVQDAIQDARRAVELHRLNGGEALRAAYLAAVGTAERAKDAVGSLPALEKLHSELTAHAEGMQEHLLRSSARRLLDAFPDMHSELHDEALQSLRRLHISRKK